MHITAAEMGALPVGTTVLKRLGFIAEDGTSVAVTGTMSIWLENTTDASMSKSTVWATATAPMTQVANGVSFIVPSGAAADTVDLTINNFTVVPSQGLYVAWEWGCAGPYGATNNPATWQCNNATNNSCMTAAANYTAGAPTSLASTNFRPTLRMGYDNMQTNDLSVEGVEVFGKYSVAAGAPLVVKARIRNNSNIAKSSIITGLNVTGANPFSDNQNIASIAPGAIETVTFAAFTPTTLGVNANTVTVILPSDNVTANDQKVRDLYVTCNDQTPVDPALSYTNGIGFTSVTGFMCRRFTAVANLNLAGIGAAMSSDINNVGNGYWCALFDNTGNIIATTNTISPTGFQLGTIINYTFATPPALTNGTQYLIGMCQPVGSIFPWGFTGTAFSPNPLPYYSIGNLSGGTPNLMTQNFGDFELDEIYQGTCIGASVNNIAAQSFDMKVLPNPATNYINISFNNAEAGASVEIMNSVGQVVMNKSGLTDTNKIDVSSLANGVYMVKVTNGKQTAIEKIIIAK